MRTVFLACVVALAPVQAIAQESEVGLGTPAGHELGFSVSGYRYVEPLATPISIQGAKFGAEYTGAWMLDENREWFLQANGRGLFGSASYDGFCRPWLITPNSDSPNGWALGLGAAFPCVDDGAFDWYVEGRALVGKDFVGASWGVSPYTGFGSRYLSNGTAGGSGYRTNTYVYLPFGVTTRTQVAQRALSFTFEFDLLLRGWQTTRGSQLGGGMVPATDTAPAFTIDGFTDTSFDQHGGWALRASAKYQITPRWSLEPYYIRWDVDDSTVDIMTVAFTVEGVTALQQMGFYEPLNTTDELGVKVGFRF